MKLAAFGLVLAAVLALPAAAATPDARAITVVGVGEAEAGEAAGEWTLVVRVENENARPALRAVTAAVGRVEAALRGAGVTDFSTDPVSLGAVTDHDARRSFLGFVASTTIEVALPDVQRAAPILDRARAAGATELYGPVHSDATTEELVRRALANGLDDAAEEAKRLAAKAGVMLGPVLTIDERHTDPAYSPMVYGPDGPYSRMRPPSRDFYATVTVTFAIS